MTSRKLKSGNWNVEAYGGYDRKTGKTIRKSFTGPDLKTLKAEAALWEAGHRYKNDSKTLSGAAKAFLKERSKVLSPSTMQGYHAMLRTLPAWLCRKPVAAIDGHALQKYVNELKVSPKTAKNRVAFIGAVMKNEGVTPPQVRMQQVAVNTMHIPDSDVVKATIKAAEPDTELWICIMLAATGPLREGEIAALSMEDIDFERNIVHVHHDLVAGPDGKYHLKTPKTKSSDRYIDMPPELIRKIKEQGYVTNWNSKGIYNRFRTLLRKNEIPRYRFHDLRHFCISELLAQGIDEIYVAERSGHSDYATMKRYVHALENRKKEISKRIIKHFTNVFTDEASEPA